MKKIRKKMGNKLMCIVAMLVAFTAMFTIFLVQKNQSESMAASSFYFTDYAGNQQQSGGQFTMHESKSTFQVLSSDPNINIKRCEWTTLKNTAVDIIGANKSGTTSTILKDGSQIELSALAQDSVNITCKVYVGDSSTPIETLNITINVGAVIDESLTGATNVTMEKVLSKDTRKSIVMNYTSDADGKNPTTKLEIGGDSTKPKPGESNNKLCMMFKSATDVKWSSDNSGVVSVSDNNKFIVATGAGKTTLRATDGTDNWDIEVYVKPEIKDERGNLLTNGHNASGSNDNYNSAPTTAVSDGAILSVSVSDGHRPEIGIGQKIDWLIQKEDVNGNYVPIKDSLGYENPEYKSEANLIYLNNTTTYKVDCKAGEYLVQFFVKGTYEKGGTALSPLVCGAVNLITTVASSFSDKPNVSINIGGSYNLSEALNMPISMLRKYFTATVEPDGVSTKLVDLITNDSEWLVNARQLGTATVYVEKNKPSEIIPGVPNNINKIKIILHIVDTYTLNVTETTMAVGATLDLHGVIGSGAVATSSQFAWSVSDTAYLQLNSEDGQYVKVTAKKSTAVNEYQTVTSKWTDNDGVTRVAVCRIIITTSESNFKINPSELKIESGKTETLTTTLTGTQNIEWLSSDPTIASVVPQAGNVSASVTAQKKTGDVVITAYNSDNKTYATCKVTVVSPVTALSIDKGNAYTVALASQFVFMKAVYQPTNATEIDMVWTSTNEKVAKVDNNGTVTLLQKGETTIQVKPQYNPNALMATCILTVTDKVMTSITADVTNLNMIRGETHQSTAKYLPVDATETNMTWTSLNTKVAKVSKDGLITAVGVGSTSIVVSANVAYDTTSNPNKFAQAVITVNVRNKLNAIKFASTPIYIAMGNSQKIDVIFNPENDINKNITWSISDTSIAKVSKDGVLTGVSEGIASLNVISEDLGGAGISTTVYVTPKPVYATNFVISPDKQTIHVGELLTLETNFSPKGVTEKNLEWSSSDEKIAKVDEKGQVTAVAVGEAVITAVYSDAPNGKPITKTCTLTVEPPIVYATDFSVSPATKNIMVGQKFSITSEFTPKDTTNQNVIYQSLDEGVITVDSKGVVKGVGAGDAIVQCQTEDGGFIGTCAVHVDNAIKFSLSPSTREIAVGNSFTPAKVTKPANATKTATWKTSNISIAKVSSTGKITGRKIGNCTITCTLSYYNQSAKCIVKVRKLNSKVSFKNSSIRIGVGQTYRMKPTVWSNASKTPSLSWRTSNKRILTVSSSGKIKGKKVGIAKITAITRDRIHAKAVCRVRVIRRATSIALNTDYTVIYVGRSKKLTVRYRPSGTTVKKVKWKSGDSGIARVTASGHVRGIAEGNTYITATTVDGSNKRAKCYVKVLEPVPATSIVVAQSDMTVKRGDKAKISYTVLPNDTSDGLKFSSDNKRVATVNKKGVIHAVGTGTAKITILATSGVTSTVNVNVVALNKTSLNMRQYDTETLMVFGSTASVTWYSSNSRVATVSNGLVTGKGKGTAYIYAYINGCKLACKVTITSVNS